MNITNSLICAAVSFAALSLAPTSSGQVLFQDNFDSGASWMNWNWKLSHTDGSVDFAYDYSALGIPAAPNSAGTTVGMRFLVNESAGVFQGISATPNDQHFTGDFKLQFDLWLNFIGPFPGGGVGSTQMATFGWGANGNTVGENTGGNTVQWASANKSILFAADGDGGTTIDYRVYRAAGGAPMDVSTGVYAAGSASNARDSNNAYYASLGGETAPAAQVNLFPSQTGVTAVGSLGMAWRDVTIEKSGDVVSWSVDGLLIASVSISGVTLAGDNIVFGMFDPFAGSSTPFFNGLNTAIFDNIRVTAVPEPSSLSLLGCGAVAGLMSRRRRRQA